jgi:putative glutamine amidotransferase
MKPLIGLTAAIRPLAWAAGQTMPAAVGWSSYSAAVATAGGAPVLLVPEGDAVAEVLAVIDGLVLTGGSDLDPALYGETEVHPNVYGVTPARDAFEIALARAALARDLPLLAVCRGIQVLNVALGGTLYQDVPDQHPAHPEHGQETDPAEPLHPVRLAPDSCLAALYEGETIAVNSLHHQAIKRLADGLRPTGWSPEGLIEAVESPRHAFVVGVQWHPEAMFRRHAEHLRPFVALVGRAAARRAVLGGR